MSELYKLVYGSSFPLVKKAFMKVPALWAGTFTDRLGLLYLPKS